MCHYNIALASFSVRIFVCLLLLLALFALTPAIFTAGGFSLLWYFLLNGIGKNARRRGLRRFFLFVGPILFLLLLVLAFDQRY